MDAHENKFDADMIKIYKTANKELKYKTTRFLKLFYEMGGLKTGGMNYL